MQFYSDVENVLPKHIRALIGRDTVCVHTCTYVRTYVLFTCRCVICTYITLHTCMYISSTVGNEDRT